MQSQHDDEIRKAFTQQAESFAASAVANASELLDLIVERGRPTSAQSWLDVACGPGVVTRHLATIAGSVVGLDATPAMVELARREAAAARLSNVTIELGDATATGFADASFDGAVTRFSLHHIPLPSRVVAELARVVKPGGAIVILDHLADREADAQAWAQEIERLRDPSHWTCLTDHRLRACGDAAGLALEHEERFAFTLDFDDWLHRGTSDPATHALIERSVASRPHGTECFQILAKPYGRILQIQLWLGLWRRPVSS